VEFAFNNSRASGIDHTPFETSYGFSHEELPDLLLPMRPSIQVSMAVHEHLQRFREVHELVTPVLQVHKDVMQARSFSLIVH
jgi:hypothetical protein